MTTDRGAPVRAILRDLGDACPPMQIVEMLATRTPAVVVGYLRMLADDVRETLDDVIRYRLDRAGIESRDRDAVELVEIRAKVARLERRATDHHEELRLTSETLATAEELLAEAGVQVARLRQTLARVLLSSLRDPMPDDLVQDVEELVGDLIHPQENDR